MNYQDTTLKEEEENSTTLKLKREIDVDLSEWGSTNLALFLKLRQLEELRDLLTVGDPDGEPVIGETLTIYSKPRVTPNLFFWIFYRTKEWHIVPERFTKFTDALRWWRLNSPLPPRIGFRVLRLTPKAARDKLAELNTKEARDLFEATP